MADAIVCLGMDRRGDGAANLQYRVRKAVELWRHRHAPVIILTGGRPRPDQTESEARAMARIATRLGVPSRALVLEEQAQTTVGNAYFTNLILHERRARSAIIVSSGFHILRVQYVFKRLVPGVDLLYVASETKASFPRACWLVLGELGKVLRMAVFGIHLRPAERLTPRRKRTR